MAKKRTPPRPFPLHPDFIAARVSAWSRSFRIFIATGIALVFVFIIGYLLNISVLSTAGGENASSYLIVVVGTGFLIYIAAWHWLVGFDWYEDRPWKATRTTGLFVLAGALGFTLIFIALLWALTFGYLL